VRKTERPVNSKMQYKISRIVGLENERLLRRPRVNFRISEYVFSYINEKLLSPNRIMQTDKYNYWFTLDFGYPIPRPNRILYRSPFSTESRLFISHPGFRTIDKLTKWAYLSVTADDIDEKIEPYEYSLVVFDMFADYLFRNYKKITIESLISIRCGMDRCYIESFQFPAPFEEQQYSIDEGLYGDPIVNGIIPENYKYKSARDEYLKHYPY
jgi:hypothetical protein